MSVELHPVLQGSPVEAATLYEVKVFVHELLQRVDKLEKSVAGLKQAQSRKNDEPGINWKGWKDSNPDFDVPTGSKKG